MSTSLATWPATAEAWLDQRGRGAWIAAAILGFIVFWPIGLAVVGYMIWSNRMTSTVKRAKAATRGFQSSGNKAFDAYKADTLRRLEDEQESFQKFLERLRESKDKAEFDQFMEERRGKETTDQ